MKIVYTDYAEIKIKKRNIPKPQIEDVLKNPDKYLEGEEGRKIAQKLIGKHLLRVVFEEAGNAYIRICTRYVT